MSAEEGSNQFENMNASENSSASGAEEVAVANEGEATNVNAASSSGAEEVATENAGAEESPAENEGAATESAASATGPVAENQPPPAPVATSGYVMSAKAKNLQSRRLALLEEMRAEYSRVFGDDKKAPKAKAYQAAGLLTIKEKQGEAAYKAKLQQYIDENQRKYQGKTVKAPKAPKALKVNSSAITLANNTTAKSGNSRAVVIKSIETMGTTAKELIDTIMSATKSLAASNGSDMTAIAGKVAAVANVNAGSGKSKSKTARKVRSNKGKTHKKKLSPVAE
jgi:hypothetical protein